MREERNERATKYRQNPNTVSSIVGNENVSPKRHGNDADMAHVVTLRTDPANPTVVYLCTPPDMASTMGGFGPARYVGNNPPVAGASYAITAEDLPRFTVYAANRSVAVVDNRAGPAYTTRRPLGREAPLPECTHCGQPTRRGTRLQHCPNCGAPWEPIEVGAPYSRNVDTHTTCGTCGHHTPAGYSHCTHCGTPHV